jgi:hypothetical protein
VKTVVLPGNQSITPIGLLMFAAPHICCAVTDVGVVTTPSKFSENDCANAEVATTLIAISKESLFI